MFVSVLISTYNWKDALALCVRSVFRQTVKPAEIVIADDGSRDDTREMIEELRQEQTYPSFMCGTRTEASARRKSSTRPS